MNCSYRYCDKEVFPPQRKFCTRSCSAIEHRMLIHDKDMKELKESINKPKHYSDKGCKYCMDSNHTAFCCPSHENYYNQIMIPIDLELGR